MNRSLKKTDRLIYLIAGFCLLLIGLIWTTILKKLEADEKKTIASAIQRNSNLAVALEQYAIRTITSADGMLQLVRSKYHKEEEQAVFRELLQKEFTELNFFNGLLIIDERGKFVFSNHHITGDIIQDFSDRSYFRFHQNNSLDQLHINEPVISRFEEIPIIVLSRRIYNDDGSFGGVMAVDIKPATFTKFYSKANLRKNEIISLISPSGITYARRMGPIESYGEDISASALFSQVAKNPVNNYIAKGAISNLPTYFSYRKLEQYPVIATVGTAQEDVLAEYYERAKNHYVFGMAITILLILFTVLIRFVLVQRKENLKKILASEAKYRSIFENSHDAIILLQPDGRIEAINHSAREIFKLSNKPRPDFFHQLYLSSDPKITLPVGGSAFNNIKEEVKFTSLGNIKFTGEMAISFYRDFEDRNHLVIIISDISQRKQMEERLLTNQQKYQQELTSQVIHAQEREREAIGHELHDNVNQILTTVKLYLEMALKNPNENKELIINSIDHILECIKEIRNLSRELSAPTLDNQSLIESIKTLLKKVESSSGIIIRFSHDGYLTALVKEQRLALFRILQEQLNNIIKHANATEVTIDLTQQDGMTKLMVKDNGKGFDPLIRTNGIGLNNILSRCKIFDGQMIVESEPDKGCRLLVILPVIEEEGIPQ